MKQIYNVGDILPNTCYYYKDTNNYYLEYKNIYQITKSIYNKDILFITSASQGQYTDIEGVLKIY